MTWVRAIYRSVAVPGADAPYDRLTLKVFYPAVFGDTPEERNTGRIPADRSAAPYPIAIFLPGINVGPEGYQWLAEDLALRCVVVTFSWIAEEFPGSVGLTPGMDLARVRPETWGSGPTCPAIAPILAELGALNEEGLLEGMLNLDRVYLGGHSAGGTMALQNANRDWFPGLRGVFTYAAHLGASTFLGWPENTVLAPHGSVPLLIAGGMQDEVIAALAGRYGAESSPTALLQATFDRIPEGGTGWLVLFDGADHFLPVDPPDRTTGRQFLERDPRQDDLEVRGLLSAFIARFIFHPDALEAYAEDPRIAYFAASH